MNQSTRTDDSERSLSDLVPLETLEQLRELFESTVGVPLVFTDARGRALTSVADPLCFCGTLVSCGSAATVCLRRKKWDEPETEVEDAIRRRHQGGGPTTHPCLGGFRDAAVPILVEGHKVGYAVFARSLTEPPDQEVFKQMARQAGMPSEVGMEVARKAVVTTAERVKQIAAFLQVITALIAKAACDTIRARRILELEQLRDSLIHMIVHDLRTPLTGVITGLETIIVADYDDEITREFVPAAAESANAVLEMVNNLLDIHRMESGKMELDLADVRAGDMARAALSQVQRLADGSGHTLRARLPAARHVVRADEVKLRRVLVNLLGNALKFTPDGGTITLRATADGAGVTFSVTDNGPGLPAEYHEKIFDKFGQAETRVAKHKHSTGLGLTFCKMVAEAHGGRIWVESEVGRGSTFLVFIPRQPANPAGRRG